MISVTKTIFLGTAGFAFMLVGCQPGDFSDDSAQSKNDAFGRETNAALVHNTPHLQSPVRGVPGDTIRLPGYNIRPGAQVAYTQVINPQVTLTPPSSLPLVNNEASGRLSLPSSAYADLPRSLRVRLPTAMCSGAIYALWIKNPKATFSEPILINDPRPQWSTPSVTYTSAALGALHRKIKIVGRNLTSRGGIRVRFTGPNSYIIAADPAPSPSMRDHVIYAAVPRMALGQYNIEVLVSGVWYPVPYGKLEVRANPALPNIFAVTSQACAFNDGLHDTTCINTAIQAASASGGNMYFDAGIWDLVDP